MADESFLLVSLDEDKSKSLAQVLSNDTSRKILDFLSKTEHATETEISKEMKVPLSTVHYNLDLLVKSNLVTNENFTYSEKGKQIVHYTLSNKYVIIAPRKTEALKEKLRQFLPVVLITAVVSLGIKFFSKSMNVLSAAPQLMKTEAADTGLRATAEAYGGNFSPIAQTQEFAVWFLFGSVFALIIYFIWAEIILKKIKKK
jgi:DNA-binding transcriptional ArsR family regulator